MNNIDTNKINDPTFAPMEIGVGKQVTNSKFQTITKYQIPNINK